VKHEIVRAAIDPAIGIARVGNSPDEYYLGPETIANALPAPRGATYRGMSRAVPSGPSGPSPGAKPVNPLDRMRIR
jgi:hypothetical protein